MHDAWWVLKPKTKPRQNFQPLKDFNIIECVMLHIEAFLEKPLVVFQLFKFCPYLTNSIKRALNVCLSKTRENNVYIHQRNFLSSVQMKTCITMITTNDYQVLI